MKNKISDEEAARRYRWIKEVRRIQKEISKFRADFHISHQLTNFRNKVGMSNNLSNASSELDLFIEGVLEGTYEEHRDR